ncbi:hypothetical protein AQUCO_06600055v1 [Aquilegia coerulea]|uniref:DUF1068 domain-containing protein n=1 Tax=Aquilegia coerulea TaxID=218851 RepID=A0A2G5CC58_AQUCA|nr:hypothetical protein AQUCO_06600055v1 [Aquilegia coerulea]
MAGSGGGGGGGWCMSQAGVLKVTVGVIAMCMAGYIIGPPLYWHFTEAFLSTATTTCSPCICDCSSSQEQEPFLSIPLGLSNSSSVDCVKRDPEVSEDMENNFTELLSEELKLRETEATENQQRADMALLEAKKMTSQYQKEADKCTSGMETCEEAREKAEAALIEQKRLTEMWELRARQRGWKEGSTKSHSQSGGGEVQVAK